MAYLSAAVRAQGGFATTVAAELDHDRDWSVPANMETLRSRPLSDGPDQSRYGCATTDPLGRDGDGWHIGPSGLPVRDKKETAA